mgnify:CR=1 FL=1
MKANIITIQVILGSDKRSVPNKEYLYLVKIENVKKLIKSLVLSKEELIKFINEELN